MPDKLDRFTKRAKEALLLAQQEALRLNHNYIGTEHLLLSLVRAANSRTLQVLRQMGVEPEQVIHTVQRVAGHGEAPLTISRPTLAPRMKQVIEQSVDEARLMGHHYIGTEHFLLGLLRNGEGIAINVLRELGIDLNRLRIETARQMLQKPESEVVRKLLQDPSSSRTRLSALQYDLTDGARAGELAPTIGRQSEIESVIQLLGRDTKHSPLLIGEPGVGKKAIVNGLAQRIIDEKIPPSLFNRHLLMLNADTLSNNPLYGQLVEKWLEKAIEDSALSRPIIFFDQMYRLLGITGTSVDIVNVIKLALSRDEVQVIGATTPRQYRKYFGADMVREWYIHPIEVKESSLEETIELLKSMKSHCEDHHQVLITDEVLDVATHLAARYDADHFLPDKAIDLIDEAGHHVRIQKLPNINELRETVRSLEQVRMLKQDAVNTSRYEAAIESHYREVELEAKIVKLHEVGNEPANRPKVTLEDIAEVVSVWTGTPVSRMVDEERARQRGSY